MKAASLRIAELICFLAALAFIIQPATSDSHYPHQVTPALLIGGVLFAVSLFLSWRRDAEHWGIAATKLLGYLTLVWVAYERAHVG
jgi:hypothetical protein